MHCYIATHLLPINTNANNTTGSRQSLLLRRSLSKGSRHSLTPADDDDYAVNSSMTPEQIREWEVTVFFNELKQLVQRVEVFS
jgi:hypothetical protein